MAFSIPPVTGWSTFWGNAPNAYAMRFARAAPERTIAHALAKPGMRQLRRVMCTLNGVAPGSAATETYARIAVPVNPQSMGGVRVVETVTASSGDTTAAQQTYINDELIDRLFNAAPSTYPVDASGNGGGNKLGR
jgi:hypothetical protein